MKQINKNNTIILVAVFVIGFFFFFACTDEERPTIEPRVEPGYSLLKVSIKNTGVSGGTYAPTTFEAYPEEKEIRSVAFFTQTDDVGDYGQPGFRAGAFGRFFSDEELRSTHGLYEPLEHSGGNYTTTLQVKSDGFGSRTQLIVIANYLENGLAGTLKSILTWEDLKSVLTDKIKGQHLGTPLVMYGSDYNVLLTDGGAVATSIPLSRIVARLDVVNEAADLVNPDNGFVLQSAQLFHPKEFGFLLPGNKQSVLIPTIASLPPVTAGNLPENDPTKITGLYLYETDNLGAESAKTSVLLKGTLFGTPFEREIPLKKPDEKGKEGDPIGLQRNHRYQLTITNIVGEDVQWDVQVADWSTGQTIDAKPELEKPVLSNITFDNGGDENRWVDVSGGHIYTYDGTQAEVIRFTASSPTHALTYAFECELDGLGESIGLNNPMLPAYQNFIKQGKPVATYATISQDYEITLPTVLKPDEYAVPVDIKVYIRNQANRYYADTITIRCRPDYLGMAGLQPAKVGGVFWAPVNVGATTTNASTRNRASIGDYYQWGRNEYPTNSETNNIQLKAASVSYEDATVGAWKDYFITGATDWLIAADANKAYRDTRWSPDVNDSPCPKGWRVPTRQEATNIVSAISRASVANNSVILDGEEPGQKLALVFGGYRATNGTNVAPSTVGYIWVYEKPGANIAHFWYNSSRTTKFDTGPLNYGMTVRCVQSITP
ncbi:fibrobacter succinogenes major paralogous domain-containing protein [Parabacteroides sp. OttesenSCG-928-G07]|nr:fibrobacter succinogenes major paralogous domain-containing protein [Parabacteroides sp. OttesenSCG-928-G07]